jgi:hypothetical protein
MTPIGSTPHTPLTTHAIRRILMHSQIDSEALSLTLRERRTQAGHDRQLARLLAARRWDRLAAAADRRARALRATS